MKANTRHAEQWKLQPQEETNGTDPVPIGPTGPIRTGNGRAATHVLDVLAAASRVRLRGLFSADGPPRLYRSPERDGVVVVAVSTVDLAPDQLSDLLLYRLAQYICSGYADVEYLSRTNLSR